MYGRVYGHSGRDTHYSLIGVCCQLQLYAANSFNPTSQRAEQWNEIACSKEAQFETFSDQL